MSISKSSKNLSVCPTKNTEASSCAGDLQDSFGLFTFSRQELNLPKPITTKPTRPSSECRLSKHSKTIQSRAKNLEIESQILREKIKGVEIEIKNTVYEESNILMYHIQKNQQKIENFKVKLQDLNAEQENLQKLRSNVEYIKGLERKNVDLVNEIAAIKGRIVSKKQGCVPHERSLKLAETVKALEEQQLTNLQVNKELKSELSRIKSVNYLNGLNLMSLEEQEKLWTAYVDVYRILCVCERVQKGEVVRINEFLEMPPDIGKTTPAQLISAIKENTKKLKNIVSDVYADHCGNICQIN